MKKVILVILLLSFVLFLSSCNSEQKSNTIQSTTELPETSADTQQDTTQNKTINAKLLYMGQASIRITTAEGKVIYIDPYAGEGYEPAADLILVTHSHYDHNGVDKVKNRNSGCRIITWNEAIADGEHQAFDLGYVKVEAVEAGYNRWHDVSECVGYVLTFANGSTLYVSGDTSKTPQMSQMAEMKLDYAFFCCDGEYNMGLAEAAECAKLVGAKHNIPYHNTMNEANNQFDKEKAEQFGAPNKLVVNPGEEITLEHAV